jgi:hypothetical protein
MKGRIPKEMQIATWIEPFAWAPFNQRSHAMWEDQWDGVHRQLQSRLGATSTRCPEIIGKVSHCLCSAAAARAVVPSDILI